MKLSSYLKYCDFYIVITKKYYLLYTSNSTRPPWQGEQRAQAILLKIFQNRKWSFYYVFFIVISVDDSFFRKCTLFTNCTFLNLTILTFYVLNLCYITCPSEITTLINRSVARLKLLVGQQPLPNFKKLDFLHNFTSIF